MATVAKASSFLQSLKSRKLILSVLGAVVALGNGLGWWSISPDNLTHFEQALGLYIVAEGGADAISRFKAGS